MMEGSQAHTISVSVPEEEVQPLLTALDEAGAEYSQNTVFKHEGGGTFVTVLLPCVLTAVQVVAAFLAARLAQQSPTTDGDKSESDYDSPAPAPTTSARVKIAKVNVSEAGFSVEKVEEVIGQPLEDA